MEHYYELERWRIFVQILSNDETVFNVLKFGYGGGEYRYCMSFIARKEEISWLTDEIMIILVAQLRKW